MSTGVVGRAGSLSRTMLAVLGVLSIVAGVVILVWPRQSGGAVATAVAVILGLYAIIGGVAYFFSGFFTPGATAWNRIGRILLGVLAVASGVVILMNPSTSAVFVVWWIVLMIGFSWIFEGVQAFAGLGMAGSKGWAIFYGIVSIAAGLTIIFSPLFGAIVMWYLVGISAVVWGVVELVTAIRYRI